MESLSDENGSGGSEVCLLGDIGGSSEVGGNSDTFNDGSQSDKLLGSGHGEGVGACLDGGSSGGGQTGLEVQNVTLLVMRNVLELIVERWEESSVSELLGRPLGDGLLVESVLEVLKLERVSDEAEEREE